MNNPPVTFLDLCSGSGGAAAGFSAAGFNVVTVDNNPDFNPDLLVDVCELSKNIGFSPGSFDVVWASPPCNEFSLWGMPFHKDRRKIPDMSIVKACKAIIDYLDPAFWIIENVRGAIPFFKTLESLDFYTFYGSRYLWGSFPITHVNTKKCYGKEKIPGHCSFTSAMRSKIPFPLSYSLGCRCMQELLSKPEGGYIHTGSRDGRKITILTDGMEDETEEINRMGSGDSMPVSAMGTLHLHLKDYKGYFVGGI